MNEYILGEWFVAVTLVGLYWYSVFWLSVVASKVFLTTLSCKLGEELGLFRTMVAWQVPNSL